MMQRRYPPPDVELDDDVLKAIYLTLSRRAALERQIAAAKALESAVLSFLLETGAAEILQ